MSQTFLVKNQSMKIYHYGKNRLKTDKKAIAKIFTDYFTSIIKQLHRKE